MNEKLDIMTGLNRTALKIKSYMDVGLFSTRNDLNARSCIYQVSFFFFFFFFTTNLCVTVFNKKVNKSDDSNLASGSASKKI